MDTWHRPQRKSPLNRVFGIVHRAGGLRSWVYLLLWVLLSALSAFAGILTARFTGEMVDVAAAGNLDTVLSLLLKTGGVAAITMVCGFLSTFLAGRYREGTLYAFRLETSRRIAGARYDWLQTKASGDLLDRMTGNVQEAGEYISTHLFGLASLLLRSLFAFYFIFSMQWQVGVLYLIITPMVVTMQRWFSRPVEDSFADLYAAKGHMAAFQQDVLNNRNTIRAYNAQGEMLRRNSIRIDRYLTRYRSMSRTQNTVIVPGLIISSIPSILLFIVTAFFIFNGQMTVGNLIALVAVTVPLDENLRKLMGRFIGIRSSSAALKRLMELWDAPPEAREGNEIAIRPEEAAISFESVRFGYEDDTPVLQDVSFAIRHGETVALIGRSGSGKSTILNLLSGLYSLSGGQIRLWGQDLLAASTESQRRMIFYVTQEPYLFTGSIRENLLLIQPGADEAALSAACRSAQLDFVKDWPDGLDTEILEGGINLSGGQRQRISIARAFLSDAPIVLLDETTASLDTVNADLVQKAVSELLIGRTSIIVAHRLSAIQAVDRVILLRDGRIQQIMSYDEMMEADRAGTLYTE